MVTTLFHSHGIGHFDYSSISASDLQAIDAIADERGLRLCPTVYLRHGHLDAFVDLMHAFHALKQLAQLPNIIGFGIEGPLVGSEGGIPRNAVWMPSVQEWEVIASLGAFGLRYAVMAPDLFALDEPIGANYTFSDLLRTCYDNGLRVALGHFRRDDPTRSAACIASVLTFLHEHYEPSPYLVLTDHLFNDMPRNFIHAWRTKEQRTRRDQEVSEFLATRWEPTTLTATLGPVPAELLQAARHGRLTPALNFDGFHVDLAICQRTLAYVGSRRVIAMTDDTESNMAAGEELHQLEGNPLRYRDDGVVALSSSGYRVQRANMTALGISSDDQEWMFDGLIRTALSYSPRRKTQ